MQHEQPHRLAAASGAAIRVQGLGKKYRIRHRPAQRYHTLRDLIADGARAALRRRPEASTVEDFWALRDVSFDVARGEVVGIIGRNGAGKSTLLKLLSRITEPSEGRAELDGRLASLLEVGTGFHPELTGRENIYLNGVILGMSRAEVRRKFDEIVSFGEIEKFLDTPVKRYSSGMYLRLAFAIAAHIDPDILVVDEILSVGDAAFQKKSLGKMDAMTRAGRTVLFVSHNMAAIGSLCHRCILLDAGRIVCVDRPEAVVRRYIDGATPAGIGGEVQLQKPAGAPPVYVTRIALRDQSGGLTDAITMGADATVEVDYLLDEPLSNVTVAMLLSREGTPLLYSYDADSDESRRGRRAAGHYRARIPLPTRMVKEGRCTIEIRIGWNRINVTDPNAQLSFEIVNRQRDLTHVSYLASRPGQLAMDIAWETKHLIGSPAA